MTTNQPKDTALELSSLTAVSPIDGRYARATTALRPLFSEYGLIRYRVIVELRWLLQLSRTAQITEVPGFSANTEAQIEALLRDFGESQAQRVKAIEATTNHDVKAVEYFLKEKMPDNKEVQAVRSSSTSPAPPRISITLPMA